MTRRSGASQQFHRFGVGRAEVCVIRQSAAHSTRHSVKILIPEMDFSETFELSDLKDLANAIAAATTVVDHLEGRINVFQLAERLRDVPLEAS